MFYSKSRSRIISACTKRVFFSYIYFWYYYFTILQRENKQQLIHAFKSRCHFFLNYTLCCFESSGSILQHIKFFGFFRKDNNHLMYFNCLFVHAVLLWQLSEAEHFLGRHSYGVYVHVNDTLQLSSSNFNSLLPLHLVMALDNCHSGFRI